MHNCLTEKEGTISKLKKDKAEAERKLEASSIFAAAAKKKLKQQIEQIERQINATNAAYDLKIRTMQMITRPSVKTEGRVSYSF